VDRINEVIKLLERFALGEIDLPADRIAVGLRLLDWAIEDAVPPSDGGDEIPELADDQVVLAFSRKLAS
jgi:hypothetical protein